MSTVYLLVSCITLTYHFCALKNGYFDRHVGGLFTGSSDGKYPGLAGLKESGELQKMINGGGSSAVDAVDPALL